MYSVEVSEKMAEIIESSLSNMRMVVFSLVYLIRNRIFLGCGLSVT